jgi:integrase
MSVSKHQLAASAYHLKPADVRKLLLSASDFRDRCLIKTLWWLSVPRRELITLDVRDFDAKRKRMTIHKSKGGKTRVTLVINDEYLSDLSFSSVVETRDPYRRDIGSTILVFAIVTVW